MVKKQTNYKQTEVGEIPQDWEAKPTSEVTEIISGGTPKTSVDEYWNGEIPWLSVADFNNGQRYIYESEKNITKEGLEHSSANILKKGMLIISARGTVGVLAQLGKDMAFNQSCYGLNAKKSLTNDFLYYALKSRIEVVKQKTHGSVFSTVTRKTFESILLPVPPLDEQQQIVSVLSSLDNKIELNRKMNKTLEEIGKALFKHWFVDFEFPNNEGNPYKSSGGEMVDSELGEIPEGWKVSTAGEYLEIFDSQRIPLSSRERAKRQGSYRYYGATGVMDFVDDFIFDGVYLLLGEDGTVTRGDGLPFTQYVWGQFWVNNHAHVLQGKNPFSTEFMKLFFDTTIISSYVTGAVQPKLNQTNLKSVPFIIPAENLVREFEVFISSLFSLLRKNEDELNLLTNIRNSLLPRLMSGKLRVN